MTYANLFSGITAQQSFEIESRTQDIALLEQQIQALRQQVTDLEVERAKTLEAQQAADSALQQASVAIALIKELDNAPEALELFLSQVKEIINTEVKGKIESTPEESITEPEPTEEIVETVATEIVEESTGDTQPEEVSGGLAKVLPTDMQISNMRKKQLQDLLASWGVFYRQTDSVIQLKMKARVYVKTANAPSDKALNDAWDAQNKQENNDEVA